MPPATAAWPGSRQRPYARQMAAMLRCELCREEPRLQVPLRYAPLMVFHTVIDHDCPVDGLSRIHRMVPSAGEAF